MSKKILLEKVLSRLEKVKQTPAWIFKTKNVLFWILWVIFVVFGGSLAVAAMAFHARFAGWNFYPVTHASLGRFVFDTLPYVWLIIFVAFLFIGYENFKNTKKGYKYPFSLVVSFSVLCCVVGGIIFYSIGVGKFLDENFGEHMPFHHPAMEQQRGFWQHPERGLLTGEVVSINETGKTFVLEDSNAVIWQVEAAKLLESDWQIIKENFGENLRLLGLLSADDENNFSACFVVPWGEEMRGRGFQPKPPSCSAEDCDFSPPPTSSVSGVLTSCEDLPGYEMILELKSK